MQDLIIENIHETKNYNLLKEVYEEILVPCFPDPEDHLSWKKMKSMAVNGIENSRSNARVLISISKKIQESGKVEPVSFFVGVYYKKSQTGLISYMGMRDGCKGLSASNIQKQVLIEMEAEAQRDSKKLKSVFSLVDLPERATQKYITLPPLQRIVIMERNGALHVPINFHYPMFKCGLMSFIKKKIDYKNDAALLGYGVDGKESTDNPEVIKDFLDDFYTSYGIDSSKNGMVQQMKEEVDAIEVGVKIKLSKQYKEIQKERERLLGISVKKSVYAREKKAQNICANRYIHEPQIHRKMLQK